MKIELWKQYFVEISGPDDYKIKESLLLDISPLGLKISNKLIKILNSQIKCIFINAISNFQPVLRKDNTVFGKNIDNVEYLERIRNRDKIILDDDHVQLSELILDLIEVNSDILITTKYFLKTIN